ncbi:MAG: hypothetical protein U0228_28810 [Myxococcaceae bacterium]
MSARFVALALVMGAARALAAAPELELTLPPPGWTEQADPVPPGSKSQKSRYFVKNADPGTELRVVSDPNLRLDYTLPVLKQIATRLVAAQGKSTPLKASDPQLIDVGGINVGTFQVVDDNRTSTLFYLPSENGDRVLTYMVPAGHASELEQIIGVVKGAKNLRTADVFANGPMIMGLMGAVSLGTLATVLFLMSRKKKAA